MRHFLIAHDLSQRSERALVRGLLLAREDGAAVTVLHVADLPVAGPFGGAGARPDTTELRSEVVAFVGRAGLSERVVVCDVALGPVAETVARATSDSGAHLVVLGTHGRTGVARAMLGSVAEAVARSVAIDVLAVRPPG